MDVSDLRSILAVFQIHPDVTHCIHLAYLSSGEVAAGLKPV